MIPLLSLGVPGDSVTAILLGAFIMKGITPGPMMYVTELPTVYRVFAALMLANLCMLVVGCLGVRFFAKIVSIEKKMLYPIILVISLLGAFSINKNAFDVGVCVAFGIIGWLMKKYEFPLSPILLALILGPMCEKNFVRYMNIQRGNFFAITTSPIAMVFATVAILVIVYSVYNQSKINKRAAQNDPLEKEEAKLRDLLCLLHPLEAAAARFRGGGRTSLWAAKTEVCLCGLYLHWARPCLRPLPRSWPRWASRGSTPLWPPPSAPWWCWP